MKRTIAIVAGLVTLGVAVYIGSRVGAQPNTQSAVGGTSAYKAPVSKVGIVNLSLIIQHYYKWLAFKDEYEREFKAEMAKIKPKSEEVENLKKRIEATRKIPVTYDDAVVKLIASRCTELESGGRMIDAILTNTMLPAISHEFLNRMMAGTDVARLHVGAENDAFKYDFGDGAKA